MLEVTADGKPFGMDESIVACAAVSISLVGATCEVGVDGGIDKGVDANADFRASAEVDDDDNGAGTGSVATTSAAASFVTAGPRRCASQKARCAASSAATPG